MTLEEAKALAFSAAQERLLNPDYRPTADELTAIDQVLIEQARQRNRCAQTKVKSNKTTFADSLMSMPNVGRDCDFVRVQVDREDGIFDA